jgi:hypothetical protein
MTTFAKFRFDRLQRSGEPLATGTPPEDKPFALLGLTTDVGETEKFKRLARPPTFSLTTNGRRASKLNEASFLGGSRRSVFDAPSIRLSLGRLRPRRAILRFTERRQRISSNNFEHPSHA